MFTVNHVHILSAVQQAMEMPLVIIILVSGLGNVLKIYGKLSLAIRGVFKYYSG